MPVPIPPYIPTENLANISGSTSWNSGDPYSNLDVVLTDTVEKLSLLSNRGILAYSIGCAYWVIYRYSSAANIAPILRYVEACLPCLFALSDRIPNELDQDQWLGNVQGPLQFSIFLIGDTWHSGEFGVPAEQGALSESLVMHAIPEGCHERTLFLGWREIVLKRLHRNFQRDWNEEEGMGVPLEILDPNIISEFDLSECQLFITSALSSIDMDNQFLEELTDFNLGQL